MLIRRRSRICLTSPAERPIHRSPIHATRLTQNYLETRRATGQTVLGFDWRRFSTSEPIGHLALAEPVDSRAELSREIIHPWRLFPLFPGREPTRAFRSG